MGGEVRRARRRGTTATAIIRRRGDAEEASGRREHNHGRAFCGHAGMERRGMENGDGRVAAEERPRGGLRGGWNKRREQARTGALARMDRRFAGPRGWRGVGWRRMAGTPPRNPCGGLRGGRSKRPEQAARARAVNVIARSRLRGKQQAFHDGNPCLSVLSVRCVHSLIPPSWRLVQISSYNE